MQLLVTGGAGYVGSTLVPMLLDSGHQVRVLDNLSHGGESLLGVWSHPGFSFVIGDIRDVAVVRAGLIGVEAVIHLAAIVGDPACARQPELARAVNLEASLSLLAESKKAGVSRFIFASTCSNYGKMTDPDQVIDETSELRPVSLYAETKVTVEQTILDPAETDGLCATSLRFATVFGTSPRMRFDLTVNEFTAEMFVNKHLVVYGEQFWRPYIHVRDIARAVQLVLESAVAKVGNEVFNVGSTGQNYRKQHIVEMIQACLPEAAVEYVRKQEDPRDYRVSFAKIEQALDFHVGHTVQEGIVEIIRLLQNGVIKDFKEQRFRN
ncbi:MAG: NAD(P)-dependent oxidoreductase [Chloroflexi bacterium]|nr:NAD(P)-dependent oxidoreductase [Chloroflexota bacterium]MCI0727417.1 NAD(P)-dependent oxidoreductase [Chloroflexota bacterium]